MQPIQGVYGPKTATLRTQCRPWAEIMHPFSKHLLNLHKLT